MNLGEIIGHVYHRLRAVDGLDQMPIRESINEWYRRINYQGVLFEETLIEETFTWSTTDGNEKDVSTVLTNWRAEPAWITSSDQSTNWERRPIKEIYERRLSGDVTYGNRFPYAVRGKYLLIVSAPTTDLTVTCAHYQNPPELDDLDDEPLLPVEFHQILVEGAVKDCWGYARKMSDSSYDQRRPWPEEVEAENNINEMWRDLTVKALRQRQVKRRIEPNSIFRAGIDNLLKRRRL